MIICSLFRKDKNGFHCGSRFFKIFVKYWRAPDIIRHNRMYFFMIAENSGETDKFDYSAIFLAATP